MYCSKCGGIVLWQGLFSNLTHTQCQKCGAINSQVVEYEPEEPEEPYSGSDQCEE